MATLRDSTWGGWIQMDLSEINKVIHNYGLEIRQEWSEKGIEKIYLLEGGGACDLLAQEVDAGTQIYEFSCMAYQNKYGGQIECTS